MLINLFRSVKCARAGQPILSRRLSLLFLATFLAVSVHAESFAVDFELLHEQEVALPDPLDPEGWIVASEEGDVTISMRSWPDSDFYAIKIDQTFDTNLSNVVGHLLDDSRYQNWIPDLKSARIIRQLDEQKSRSVYMHLEMPWPLDDRDSIIGQRITQNPETLVVTIKEWNEGASLPEKHDVVRSPRINSEYVLIPLSPNKVRSIWQGHQEPGGSVPSFLVNWMIDNIYEESAANMQVQFEDPALKHELDWISDPQP
jgi:START domain-containing protein